MSSLTSRIVIGLIGFPSIIFLIINHILIFFAIVIFCYLLAFQEYVKLIKTFSSYNKWFVFGIIYILGSMISLIYLRTIDDQILSFFTFLLFSGVMINDSMAFIVGKLIKGPKILPNISPNKTVSGFFGGLVGSIIFFSYCNEYILPIFTNYQISMVDKYVMILICNVVGFFGDSFESYLKRKAKIKDSSNILMGHGGMFDRLDSLILTTPVTLFYVYAYYL